MQARERSCLPEHSAGPASRLWNSVAISYHPPNLFHGARAIHRRRLQKFQILGPGKTSSSRRKSITSAKRSSCRNIPMQCGTFSGACSSKSSVSASDGRGSRWKSSLIACSLALQLSCEPPHCAKQVFPCKGLRHVCICTLLLAPKLVTGRVFRGHHNHGDHIELGVPLQVAANLETISSRHNDVQQDYTRPLVRNGFFHAPGIMQRDRPIAFSFQQALHQLDLSRRVINNQDLFVHSRALPVLVRRAEVHVGSQLLRSARSCVVL